MTKSEQQQRSPRLGGVVTTLFLGWFLLLQAQEARLNYWILADAKQGTATMIGEAWSGHGRVDYTYQVGQQEYKGRDGRPFPAQGGHELKVGEQTIVYYSGSHPWLSRLNMPHFLMEGLPVVVIVLLVEIWAIFTVIKPKSGWAMGAGRQTK